MLNAWIEGIGLLGPGLDGWPQALAVLRGEAGWANAPAALPAPELLPAAERRRASRIVKATLAAGLQACRQAGRDPASLPGVFASSGGDGHNCHAICELLAGEDRQVSPTRFHNSVHNAAAGYWSIATGATPASQTLSAHDASFAAGLLEAVAQVATGGQPVLLLASDSDHPEPLRACRPVPDASALALVLAPAPGPASACPAGARWPKALPTPCNPSQPAPMPRWPPACKPYPAWPPSCRPGWACRCWRRWPRPLRQAAPGPTSNPKPSP